jgi:hypothetical protein
MTINPIPVPKPVPPDPPASPKQYFGKYRGIVLNNTDPMQLGRIFAQVSDVSQAIGWAMPCVPYSAPGTARTISIPPINAKVWIEFEQGNPDFPIWTGCFWAVGNPPLITVSS